jgi:hypothetical protein
MPRALILLLVALSLSIPTCAATFHVSPAGQPSGDGSAERPWDLATALAHPAAVRPGDTILLHAGTYTGAFASRLKGTAGAPVTLRAAPGERATIDCVAEKSALFTVGGEHAVYQGFEVTCSAPKRRTDVTGSHPPDINRGGVNCHGAHIRFVNLVVHDTAQGFGFWSSGEAGEIYGCLIYYNGWVAPDRGHGHAIYAQNKTGTKRLIDNVMFDQFSYGVHAYGSKAAFLVGFHLEGNVAFTNGSLAGPDERTPGILVGGGSPAQNVTLVDNFTWADRDHTTVQLGYTAPNKDLVARGNYIVGGLKLGKWESPLLENNTVVARAKGLPKEEKVFVRPNRYEPGRAHVIVYNWPKNDAVAVDLSAVLKPGQPFRVQNTRDFYGEAVLSGTYDGRPVQIPMKPSPPARPVGMPDYALVVTQPEFGVFVVLPVPPAKPD